ncbi:MAG: hypothetical protein IT581_22205 [Verrucomicrobiales bacterium]|nr:hypothetical protein [Verrucomicrobiales bacterium]
MKRKHLLLALAAVLALCGWWLARSSGLSQPPDPTNSEVHADAQQGVSDVLVDPPQGGPEVRVGNHQGTIHPGQHLRPPDPRRRFIEFTPEQRVEFARRGHGPGG